MATTHNFISSVRIVNTQPIFKGPDLFDFLKRLFGLGTPFPTRSAGRKARLAPVTSSRTRSTVGSHAAFINLSYETKILEIKGGL